MTARTAHRIRLLVLVPCLLAANAAGAADDPRIALVEENLLPYQVIAGQEPYRLRDRMEHYGVPGVSIALVDDCGVRWTAQYGVRSAATGEPVAAGTLFNVGSLSKAVTSALILALVQQGRVDLEADVEPQLKTWHLPANEFTAGAPVTPLLLMNHSAGLPHRPPYSYTAAELPTIRQVVGGEPPSRSTPLQVVQRPGTAFQYSNGGFSVLQILAEDVTGLGFAEAAQQLVFAPLGLADATFATPLPADRLPAAATGHRPDGTVYADPPVWMAHTAAGGLWISAADYARFVVEIQKFIRGESNRLFSRELAEAMTSPHAATQYGLGVFLYEGDGSEPYFSHIGDGPGFVGGYTSHRTSGDAVVVLTNGQGGINLCREILRSVARVYDWPGYLPPTRTELPLSAAELADLAGRYRFGLDTTFSLEADGGRLRLTGDDLPGYPLFRVAPDTFVCRERNGEILLQRGPGSQEVSCAYRLSDEIGRLSGAARRGARLAVGEATPLEMLRSGRTAEACAAYRAHQATHPDAPEVAESRFNQLGYRLLQGGDLDGALAIFRLNTELYPGSGNVFDSYGEALLKAGRTQEGLAAYRRALELDPGNGNARKVLAGPDAR